MDETLRCHHCGDVIGAYEPVTMLADGVARITSRAAAGDARAPLGECYHAACYARAHPGDPILE
jgi:hypothetical protein